MICDCHICLVISDFEETTPADGQTSAIFFKQNDMKVDASNT